MVLVEERKAAVTNAERSSPDQTVRIEVYVDEATSPLTVLTKPPFHLDLDTSSLSDGPHTLRFSNVRRDGTRSERRVPFVVQNHTAVDVKGLEAGDVVRGTVGIDVATAAKWDLVGEAPQAPVRAAGPSPWWYVLATAVIFGGVWLFFLLVPTYDLLAKRVETASSPGGVDPAVLAAGETLYNANCLMCHQATGAAMGTAIPALAGNADLADTTLVLSTISHGTAAMLGFPQFDAEQLANVATYVRVMWDNGFSQVTQEEAAAVIAAGPPAAEAAPAPAAEEAAAAEEPAPAAEAAAAPAQPAAAPAATPAATPAAEPAAAAAEEAPAEQAAAEEAAPAAAAEEPAVAEEAAPAEPAAAPAAVAAGGETVYVVAPTPLAAADGTQLATVTLGAPITQSAASGDAVDVVVEGWSMETSPSAIFYTDAQRIPLASLSDAGQAAREVLESKTDDYGTTWQKVRLSGQLAQASVTSDPDAGLWPSAAELYAATCGGCHAVHSTTDYTANQWPGTIQGMLQYVTLSNQELDLITKYVQYHANDMQ